MPLHFGKFTIHDYEPKRRILNMAEVFTYSSNIGAARMARRSASRPQGVPAQAGPARPAAHRIAGERRADRAEALGRTNTITIAFGHGLSVAPLQAVMGVSALVNGGMLIPPTFLKRCEDEARRVPSG